MKSPGEDRGSARAEYQVDTRPPIHMKALVHELLGMPHPEVDDLTVDIGVTAERWPDDSGDLGFVYVAERDELALMRLRPDGARELAAALVKAADATELMGAVVLPTWPASGPQ